MKRQALVALLLLVSAWTAACGGQPGVTQPEATPIVSHGGPVKDYVSLVDALRGAGVKVEPAGDASQEFLSPKGQAITVNGERVEVYEYPDAAAADAEAARISPNGSSTDTMMITWIATPHFFKKDKLIVLYVGDSAAIVKALEGVLGPQFAGG